MGIPVPFKDNSDPFDAEDILRGGIVKQRYLTKIHSRFIISARALGGQSPAAVYEAWLKIQSEPKLAA